MAFSTDEFFEAISQIVDTKIGQVKFDTTIICEIVDNTYASEGKYYVYNGSTNFYAYTSNSSYKNGDSVYVTIPQGDYNNQKLIVGKHTSENESGYISSSPLDNFVEKKYYEVELPEEEMGIVANFNYNECTPSTAPEVIPEEDLEDYYGSYSYLLKTYLPAAEGEEDTIIDIINGTGFNALKVSAAYKTNLEYNGSLQRKIVQGTYGLTIIFTVKGEESSKNVAYSITSLDLQGNPFDYETWSVQENLILLDDILPSKSTPNRVHSIEKIEIRLTQDGKFIYTNGQSENKLTYYNIDGLTDTTYILKEPNINIKDISFDFGYTQDQNVNTELYLDIDKSSFLTFNGHEIVNSEKYYYYSEIPTEAINQMKDYPFKDSGQTVYEFIQDNYAEILKKYNQKSFKYTINIEKVESSQVDVHVFQYQEGRGKINSLAGVNWVEIADIKAPFDMSTAKQSEKFKAIGQYEDPLNPGHTVTIESNELIISLQGTSYEAISTDVDYIEVDYDGNFNFYDDKGFLVNGFEAFKQHKINLELKNIKYGTITEVVWEIPYEDTNIIMASPQMIADVTAADNIFDDSKRAGYKAFKVRTPEIVAKAGQETHSEDWGGNLFFTLKDYASPYALNNTIYCSVYKNGSAYKLLEKKLNFGTFDQYGAQYKLAAIPREGKILSPGDTNTYDIKIYDADNKDVTEDFKERGIYPKAEIFNPDSSYLQTGGFNITTEDNFKSYCFDVEAYYYTQSVVFKERVLEDGTTTRLVESGNTRVIEAERQNLINISTNWSESFTHNNVVKLSIESEGLVGYLPLAVHLDSTIAAFEAPSFIRYNHGGTDPEYYKGRIGFADDSEAVLTLVGLPNDNNNLYKYSLTNGVLMAPPVYFSNVKTFTILAKSVDGVFKQSQPVVVVQDVWTDRKNNSWVNSTVNGHTISQVNAASIKKSSEGNYFDGVIIGEVDGHVGLFGFKNGEIVFELSDQNLIDSTSFLQ